MLCRAMSRANTSVRKWEIATAQPYDTSKVGSSALLASLDRNLLCELAYWLGQEVAAVLPDHHTFFDRMDVPTLINESIQVDFSLPASGL